MGAIDVAVGAVRTDMPEPGRPAPSAAEKPVRARIDAQFGGRWETDPGDVGERMSDKEAHAADMVAATAAESKRPSVGKGKPDETHSVCSG